MWELFVQAGPVGKIWFVFVFQNSIFCSLMCHIQLICLFFLVNVHMPKDRVTQMHQGYGFVEFMGEEDADYAIKVLNMIKLYGKPIRVNKVSCRFRTLSSFIHSPPSMKLLTWHSISLALCRPQHIKRTWMLEQTFSLVT